MKTVAESFFARIHRDARRHPGTTTITSAGRVRVFRRYDLGEDTFVLESGAWKNIESHAPVLIVKKSALARGLRGRLMTLATGNHATAALPLLAGKFPGLPEVPSARRGAVLTHDIVCANIVGGRLEISQRDVPVNTIAESDLWLQDMGWPLDAVVMSEREDATLERYRRMGQEWRIKPLAWTDKEIAFALRVSRTSINTKLKYYHSAKGVHFLAYPDFHALIDLARKDFPAFVACLRELVAMGDGEVDSNMRKPKFHGHHEIELFGIRRGFALAKIVPRLEQLMEKIALKTTTQEAAIREFARIVQLCASLLERPALKDAECGDFAETLYLHLSGEIYWTHNDLASPAFDDRRTALPGATFRNGFVEPHPGADDRTRALLRDISARLSADETIEYANVYEIRGPQDDEEEIGTGHTREIVFKTNRIAIPNAYIEKRLAQDAPGYGSYMLARVEAFRELGVNLPGYYKLLSLRESTSRRNVCYYLRSRCPGEALADISPRLFRISPESTDSAEDPRVVLGLASILGNAAAQTLVLKKYIEGEGCRFGVGKEIFEFGYSPADNRIMPLRAAICSARGTLGWKETSKTDGNLNRMFVFYAREFARALVDFHAHHEKICSLAECVDRFLAGFAFKTREMHWGYVSRREQFDSFAPGLPSAYAFRAKWSFALWALGMQVEKLPLWSRTFRAAVRAHANKRRKHR